MAAKTENRTYERMEAMVNSAYNATKILPVANSSTAKTITPEMIVPWFQVKQHTMQLDTFGFGDIFGECVYVGS